MKTIKDKQILVGADFAGFPLKEAVVAHLKKKGWTVTDVGVRTGDEEDTDLGAMLGREDGGFEDVEMRDLIRKVMEKLSAAEKKILQMRYFEEHSQREVAAEMGVSQMYVSRVERKMLARFREVLA